jgi:hypothetical protein
MKISESKKFKWFSKKWDENFIVTLPIINAIASVFTNYFPDGVINPGQIRVILVISFGLYFLTSKFSYNNKVTKLVIIYIFYIFFLTILSNYFTTSFNIFIQFFASTICVFFGIHYIKNDEMLKRVSLSILVMLGIFILNFTISNLFELGLQSYSGVQNQLNFGSSGVNLAKQITPILLMMPIIVKLFIKPINKKIIYLLIFGGVLFILYAFKRTPLFGLIISYITIGLILPNKSQTTKYALILAFISILLSPIYLNQVLDNFQAREKAIDLRDEENLEKQARYHEYNFSINSWEKGDLGYKFFGTDIFATHEAFNLDRMMHSDYMALLNGSGIIGLFGFILLYFYKIYYLWKKTILYKSTFFMYSFAVGSALVVNFLIMGVSGIIQAVEPRATVLLFLGMLIGYKPNKSSNDSNSR